MRVDTVLKISNNFQASTVNLIQGQGSDKFKEDDDCIQVLFKIKKKFHSITKPPLDHQNRIYLEINWRNRK